MQTLRLRNFKCLKDTGTIDLKPLTLLVGANSSGKSSFLRFFPLLRQSMGKNKRGVFLWYGNDVDFRDFHNTVHVGEDNILVSFSLKDFFEVDKKKVRQNSYATPIKISFQISAMESDFDKMDWMRIKYGDETIEVTRIEGRKVLVSVGQICSTTFLDDTLLFYNNALLPGILFSHSEFDVEEYSKKCLEKIVEIQKKYNPEKGANPNLSLTRKPFVEKDMFLSKIKNTLKGITDEEAFLLYDLRFYYYLNKVIDTINISLLQVAKGISYIGPLRKSTDRFYRFSNLAIDEIDPDGANLPMFLHSLSTERWDNLNKWLMENFSFKISELASEGNVQIMIEESSHPAKDLTDVGFGYTQLLPILINIWKTLYLEAIPLREKAPQYKREHTVVIEQPELHLHPRMQDLFAQTLLKALELAKEREVNLKFLIETHSKTIISRIGIGVAKKEIMPEDVSVVLFNAPGETEQVRKASFSSDGRLNNWPVGFFL